MILPESSTAPSDPQDSSVFVTKVVGDTVDVVVCVKCISIIFRLKIIISVYLVCLSSSCNSIRLET